MTFFDAAAENVLSLQSRLIEVFDDNKSAVVRVKAAFREIRDEGTHVTLKVGTGFFISSEGHVLVNASRAAGADRIWVEADGETHAAEAIGHDPLTNISLLRTLEPPDPIKFIPIDSGTKLPQAGALVISVSCPLDFGPSPGMGVVSGIENRLGPQVFPTEYIRTTVSVDMGQGGCPILDINGRLVGMTVASIPEIGSSYAMPVEALIRVRDDLLNSGKVVHSWMGFEIGEARDLSGGLHVHLSKIVEGSPAAETGLQQNDVLLSINGRDVDTAADVPHAVFFTRAGQYATVRVKRDDEELEFSVKTLPRPDDNPLIITDPKPVVGSSDTGAQQAASEEALVPAPNPPAQGL